MTMSRTARSGFCPSPSVSSLPNTTALALEMLTQCTRASRRRLKLMSAASMPILAMPSHRPTYCERFSMNRATTSPSLKPRSCSRLATRFEYSSSCLKLHRSPVPSKISAVLSPYFCTDSAKILGMVLRSRRCRFTFSFTFSSTTAALWEKKTDQISPQHTTVSVNQIKAAVSNF